MWVHDPFGCIMCRYFRMYHGINVPIIGERGRGRRRRRRKGGREQEE